MQYYLFYCDEIFYAYTDNESMMKKMNKIFPDTFTIIPIKAKKLNRYLLENPDAADKELLYYNGYRNVNEIPIRECDMLDFEFMMTSEAIEFKHSVLKLIPKIKYLKISDDDKKAIVDALYQLEDIVDDITMSDHEVIYDEVIDIKRFMQHWFRF